MEYVRIDKGISRGPRHKHQLPQRSAEAVGKIPPTLRPAEVLERYLTESTTSQIAASYGVSRKTLVRWLVEQAPNDWKQVQVVRALCRKENADEEIEVACDALSLARAREMLRSGQWDLERLDPANYSPQQRVEITMPQLGPALQELEERRAARQAVSSTVSCAAALPVLPSVSDVTDVSD